MYKLRDALRVAAQNDIRKATDNKDYRLSNRGFAQWLVEIQLLETWGCSIPQSLQTRADIVRR